MPNDIRRLGNHDLLHALNQLTAEVYRLTGRKGVLEVKVTSDVGLMLGLVPGESAIIDGITVTAAFALPKPSDLWR